MKVLVAPDSFKESLSAVAVAQAIATGWSRSRPDDTIQCLPLADGGEGTLDTLLQATQGTLQHSTVTGPHNQPVEAQWGLLNKGNTALIEMAQASGLELLDPEQRDPCTTTTFGTGELVRAALDHGARDIIVTLGGSATNDGGAGMAQALGYEFLDANGDALPLGGAALINLAHIDATLRDPRLDLCTFRGACDVENPLCGPQGATAVYGPQKGLRPEDMDLLDQALQQLAICLQRDLDLDIAHIPGAGAAGGLGAGLMAFCGATLNSGFALVAGMTRLAPKIDWADLVITGEGRMDGQSVQGKVVGNVGRMAQTSGTPTIALCGTLGEGYEVLYTRGIVDIHSLDSDGADRAELMAHAAAKLEALAADVAASWI